MKCLPFSSDRHEIVVFGFYVYLIVSLKVVMPGSDTYTGRANNLDIQPCNLSEDDMKYNFQL